jgi:hypothetical protein
MMIDARAVSNRFLACDWCGLTPDKLYLPANRAGVFCRDCVGDVLNPPPPKPVTLAKDGMPADNDIGRALDAYLKSKPKEPTFCGRGRPRKKPLEPPKLPGIGKWRYFARVDRLRIVTQKRFSGGRARVWACVTDGATVGEVLERAGTAGVDEPQAVAVLRKMIKLYAVLRVDRAA